MRAPPSGGPPSPVSSPIPTPFPHPLSLSLQSLLLLVVMLLCVITTCFSDSGEILTNTSPPRPGSLRSGVGPLKKTLTVGYLTAIKGEMKDKQGLAVSGALSMVLDEINNDPTLLPNVTLALRWSDTRGDTVLATRAMTDMLCDGVVAFFGPEGTCHVEAIVAQSRNVPMVAYKCSDYKASRVPTFARTEPPDTQVTKSVISLLHYYSWHQFSIIAEEAWSTVAGSLLEQARARNMTVNHLRTVIDSHKCCEMELPCCHSSYWYQVISETRNRTRIYVFLGTPAALIDMMNSMDNAQLFDAGEYLVIYVDMMTYSPREALKYLYKPDQLTTSDKQQAPMTCYPMAEKDRRRARSLLVLVLTPPTKNYENFTAKVRKYNAMEPFNFSVPVFFEGHNFVKFVSIYAAYLYDSVMLYATALDELLKKHEVLTDNIIDEVASNGTEIVSTIIRHGSYQSITGATIKLDEYGDSEGNFSVLALKPAPGSPTCYHLVPVGLFFQEGRNKSYPEYRLNSGSHQVDWPGGMKPEDEPSCGFMNEKCPKDSTHINSVVAAGALAVTLFCASVITMSIYRKWKIEQEIEGLLWKIDSSEIHGYFGNDIVSSPSKLSLASAASFGSRCSNQVFTATAKFRSVVVRVKELKFSKKKDISREIMKEMRLLRDLRHDNINSFIGACVEPLRLLLITDYCAKGSLYDIIENEDIKLDEMFIASLVHDLIKGMLYIHGSPLGCHGNLKSSNCVVTSRWMLQVTDFGLHELRHCAESDSIGEHQYYRSLFWRAPELLRDSALQARGTTKGDVYAFAIILYEIIGRRGPFGCTPYEPKDIVDMVKRYPAEGEEPFRPDIDLLQDSPVDCADYIVTTMQDCWAEIPDQRPDFTTIRARLKKMHGGKSRNIMDQMMDMMEKYADNLEDIVNERTRLLCEEKRKTEDLLHRMLPEPVANRLTKGHGVEPVSFDSVTIYFSDIVGFTAMSAESTPLQVVNFLNDLYTVFDRIIKGYDVYKVETIGDAYMVVSGLPIKNEDRHVGEIASMSLDLLAAVRTHQISHRPNETLKLRIGVHTGPVVAGVVGLTMPRYCLFGDTVNTASRMESNGEPLKIHISPQCKEALDKLGGYVTEERGLVNMKGKGEVLTYWLTGATDKAVQKRDVDLGELPPLFCRPRRSPKLTADSRQPSLIAMQGYIFGAGSRRQSSVPRGNSLDVDSTNSLQISGIGAGGVSNRKFIRSPLYLATDTSRNTLSPPEVSSEQTEVPIESKILKPSRLRSSTTAGDYKGRFNNKFPCMRESRSLDPFPSIKNKRLESPHLLLKLPKLSSKSLENTSQISTININKHINNNTFANGNAVLMNSRGSQVFSEDAALPLLRKNSYSDVTIIPEGNRRRINRDENDITWANKRWRSLETVPGPENSEDGGSKKLLARGSIRSWLLGLFNGSGLRSSNASLRKGVLTTGYNDIQPEKESIV